MGASVSSGFLPWAWRAPRPFPALVWLEQRYPFRLPRPPHARQAEPQADAGASGRRPFPARVWLEQRQAGRHAAA